jgi:hypothetical protein
MEGDRIAMSLRERDRLKVMSAVLEGRRTQGEAARLMGLCERQVRRIQRRLEAQGDGAIIHKLRGRPSNRRIEPGYRRKVLERYRKEYSGFGPTFAAEKLSQGGLAVAVSTVRRWLLEDGLWQRRRRRPKHRRWRKRSACPGELVQADGSHHDWLEGRGPQMVLAVMIDDATSRVMARFYPAETTEAYMDLLRRYLGLYGRMVALYVDGDSIFRSEDRHPEDPQPHLTQFGRALKELDIALIPAGSPQAKGRVERFNGTAQDRLVKELRLARVSTLAKANQVLDEVFLPWFDARCTVEPQSPVDAHRLVYDSMNLDATLSIQHTRRVANDYTIRFRNQFYQLLRPAVPGLRGGRLTVEERMDGSLHLRFRSGYLGYELIGPAKLSGALPPPPRSLAQGQTPAQDRRKQGSAAQTTEPCAVSLTHGRSGRTPAEPYLPRGDSRIARKEPWRPAPDHPWRRGLALKKATGHF